MCRSCTKFVYTVRQVPLLRGMHSPEQDVLGGYSNTLVDTVEFLLWFLVVVLVAVSPPAVRRFQVHRLHLRGHHSLPWLGNLLLGPSFCLTNAWRMTSFLGHRLFSYSWQYIIEPLQLIIFVRPLVHTAFGTFDRIRDVQDDGISTLYSWWPDICFQVTVLLHLSFGLFWSVSWIFAGVSYIGVHLG